ncbi:MAG: L-threonylcarbamoyladenylate synthase [Eubacteriales bacterium]|nr:L-threonylcarbamoyladenylate synthase [Eubacteriales bacterium]
MSHAILARMTEENPDHEALKKAGKILREGGLVAFPTETVYGLGGDALNPESSKKIYAAKGRPSDNPLIIHIADRESLLPLVQEVPAAAERLMDAYWPGPLTMIFRKSEIVPYETTGGLDTVAVRFPNNRIACEMIREAGGYVAAPSANTSGRPSPTLASHVEEDLGDKIDMILDGGQVEIGLESTIVDFTEETPVILRPGFLNQQMLEEVLAEVRMDPGLESENVHVRPKAPGMRYRHYAPKAKLAIVQGKQENVFARIRQLVDEGLEQGAKIGVICTEESRAEYPKGEVRCIGSRADDRTIARHLFEILRDFDSADVDRIYTESFDTPHMGQAIMNRLIKAAGHEIIDADTE